MSLRTQPQWTTEVNLKDGSQVLLRPETSSDLEMVWGMYSTLSNESRRSLPSDYTRETIDKWFKYLNYDYSLPIVAIVEEKSRQRIVGTATLQFFQQPINTHKAEFAIVIHDDYQNRGLGTLLTKHMINIALGKGLKKVFLVVLAENQRAIRLYEKLGFKIEGKLLREHYHTLMKEYVDAYRMAILLT